MVMGILGACPSFSIEARMLSTYQKKVPSNFKHVENGKRVLFERERFGGLFNFGKLPKANPVPPSGPSGRGNFPSTVSASSINFGKLPKANPVPPSGPSGRGNFPSTVSASSINFGKLPKANPVPPSGPSG
ncbi:hypothetical protein FCV25MIE_15321 [Fagus crenata]